MSIQCFEIGFCMSQVVVYGDIVYLVGVVVNKVVGESVIKQIQDILVIIDGYFVKVGIDKLKLFLVMIYIIDMKIFGEMNVVWDVWVLLGNMLVCVIVEVKLVVL